MTDERPKPKYGELAPEGWVWKPPQEAVPDADESASPAPATVPARSGPVVRDARAPGAPASSRGGSGDPGVRAPIATGDAIVTSLLLAIGFFTTINSIASLLDLRRVIQQVLDIQKIDVTYTATGAASLLGIVGSVVLALIYAAAVWLSVKALRARRRAFFIPLACGVLSFMALFFVLMLAFFADGALINAIVDSQGA
ncbi:DUF6264 family protein [Herbiconiux sp. CPCC 205763]|uniref:DUF6264 family protein n=1 Tax=Herbiconiux aconitum TaxID=2970913 RepID=A0ABT2GS37_9MICO|nr:DUF6264 family protein [Herbiconiux aconitum]MCS5719038.1 DUF6264 family protein [Herbiconiux aconitum]